MKEERCYGKRDWEAKGRTNEIGGLIDSKVDTVGLIDSLVNVKVFTAWVEKFLLLRILRQSVIEMNNATLYKSKAMKKSNKVRGMLYLPTYSPNLNPIQKKSTHVK